MLICGGENNIFNANSTEFGGKVIAIYYTRDVGKEVKLFYRGVKIFYRGVKKFYRRVKSILPASI